MEIKQFHLNLLKDGKNRYTQNVMMVDGCSVNNDRQK